MKNLFFGLVLTFLLGISIPQTSQAQTVELLAGNTLNGAVNGTLLGGAYMAVSNTAEFAPLRVGLGLGTLYGIGIGGYDVVYGQGAEILVSGLFNDGNNSSIIVLLDTFYGAAAGAVIVTSILLVANEPLLDGLQYGAGIGAWAGFGFGVFDAFVLAKRTKASSPISFNSETNEASGLVGIQLDSSKSIGLVNPTLSHTYTLSSQSFGREIHPAVELVNFRLNF